MAMPKAVALATLAGFSFVPALQAADAVLPVPVVPVADVSMADADFDWSGFYAGIGATASRSEWTYSDGPDNLLLDPQIWSGEVVLGGNAQFGAVVVGLEATGGRYRADLSGAVSGSLSDLPQEIQDALAGVDGTFTGASDGWYAGLEARAGYLVTPSILLYGSLGVTGLYSEDNTSFTYTDMAGVEQTETADFFGNAFGSLGLGAEFALNDSLSVDLQYKYYGFSVLDYIDDSSLNSSGHGVSAQVLFHF